MHGLTNEHLLLLGGYCVLILLASLVGGWAPMLIRLTHTRLQMATSFVSGLMLGIALLHLVPHAWFQMKSIDRLAWWMTAGFLVMFFAQRFFHFHHHDVAEEDPESCGSHSHSHGTAGHDEHDHHPHQHTLADKSARHLSWTGALFGLTLHTLINGVALAASVAAGAGGDAHGAVVGLGTFLAIFLHKPFDAMAITTLMTISGKSRGSRHLANLGFALVIPVGALLFFLGASQVLVDYQVYVGCALAFAAGTFLCMAASDLLPELQFHSHDRIKLSVALLLGIGLAVGIGLFESSGHEHHHDHETDHAVEAPTQPE